MAKLRRKSDYHKCVGCWWVRALLSTFMRPIVLHIAQLEKDLKDTQGLYLQKERELSKYHPLVPFGITDLQIRARLNKLEKE